MKTNNLIKTSPLFVLPFFAGAALAALKFCNAVPQLPWWVVLVLLCVPAIVILLLFVVGLIFFTVMYFKQIIK